MMMFGIIACMGLKVMVMNHIDVAKSRNLIIVAVILIIGIGFDTGGVKMVAGDVEITPMAVATLFGIFLNLVLPQKLPSDATPDDDDEASSTELKEQDDKFESEYSSGRARNRSEDDDDENSESVDRNTVQV